MPHWPADQATETHRQTHSKPQKNTDKLTQSHRRTQTNTDPQGRTSGVSDILCAGVELVFSAKTSARVGGFLASTGPGSASGSCVSRTAWALLMPCLTHKIPD